MNFYTRRIFPSLAIGVLLPLGSPAQAQTPSASMVLEEIVVSARKRDESLQNVPIAIDAYTAEQIQRLQIDNAESLARHSASLQYDTGVLPQDTRPVIRSVNTQRGRPNVGIMVDFVDVSSEALTVGGGGMTANLRLLDLQRIEVVKGPQSALYGRSAFSGAINYVTKRPEHRLGGEFQLSVAEHGTSDVKLSINAPLIQDSLAAKLVLSKYDTDGAYTNPNTGGELGSEDSFGAALAFDWQAGDSWNIYFRAEHSEDEYAPRAEAFLSSVSPLFDPAVNFFGTGTVNDFAVQRPYDFSGATSCNGADRIMPYWDSFGAGPACRPIIAGELNADESQIDLSPDPRTGRDFTGTDIENSRLHLDVSWRTESLTVQYILGFMDNKTFIQEDFDKNNIPILSAPGVFSQYGLSAMSEQNIDTKQWNHELRLSGTGDRVSWMLSALKWDEEMDVAFGDEWWLREGGSANDVLNLFNAFVFNFLDPGQFSPGFCALFYPGNAGCVNDFSFIATEPGNTPAVPLSRETDHTSIAGLISISLNEQWSVTLEGRYLDETIDYSGGAADVSFFSQFGGDPLWGFLFGPGELTYNSVEDDAFVPKVSIDWLAQENLMVYLSYAEGFKPGGIATVDANGDVRTGEYQPEELAVWELGFKSELRNSSIRLNGAAFFYDYTDQQVPYFFIDPATNLLNSTVINAGETEIRGVEFDLLWRSAFVEGVSVALSYVYTDAEFSDFNMAEILAQAGGTVNANSQALAGNAEGDFSGKKVPMTAEHSATMALRYDRNYSRLSGYIELLGSYQSKRYLSEGNLSWLPARTQWDLYAGLQAESWSVDLFVENLLDEDKVHSGLPNVDYGLLPDAQNVPSAVGLFLPQPRTAGLRFSYRF